MWPEEVDDPSLPCRYCCSVEMDEDDPWDESKWFVLAPQNGDLVVIDRMYRDVHPECEEMVARYMEERQNDPF